MSVSRYSKTPLNLQDQVVWQNYSTSLLGINPVVIVRLHRNVTQMITLHHEQCRLKRVLVVVAAQVTDTC